MRIAIHLDWHLIYIANMKYYFLFITILIISCNTEKNDNSTLQNIQVDNEKKVLLKSSLLDTIKNRIIAENKNYKDTATYTFSLNGNFSAEGNEGKAYYKDSKIYKIDITFYGEMGKSTYSYTFGNEKIKVEEKIIEYDSTLSGTVKSTKKVDYDINFEGKMLLSDVVDADTDTFLELKKSVPFVLK